ncbi:beta strand repeat-containing protein, partial [Zobellia laminariae]|uniref:beta strand repeat-containing protein n=1 Tax=Zobellia laminariae TaxID=248906 RepID=UPI003EF71EC8
ASADGSIDVVRTGDDFDLSITIPTNNDNDATNEFQDLSLTGDNLTLSDDPTATAIDLSPYANNDTNEIQTVASADGSVDVVRTGDDFDLSITIPTNNDNDATNEIQDLGIAGDQLSITGGNTVTIPTADGSETIVNGAGINSVTGSGTTASPYVVTGTEVDGDITNEIQTVASADGSVDVVRTGDDFDLSITIPTNNDNDATNEIQDLGIAGDQLSITGGNTVTIPTADGSETIVNGAGINAVTGSGTTASPYVVTGTEVDGDIRNEIQTVASADGSVDVVRTGDDFDLSITIPTNNDNDATNEFQDLSLTGDNLTLSDDPTATAIDLSPYANNDTNEIQTVASADGSVDVVRTGDDFDLSITIPANNDNDATNEIQTVASADGSVDVVRTGDDFDLSITIPANNDNDATNEIQDLGIAGDQLSITGGNTVTIPTADGSETIVNGAGINAVTGSGTTASPYVVTGTEVDGDITNEIQTVASSDGSVDVVRTGDDFDLSITIPANNDNDATNEFQDLSLTGDNLTLSDDPTATAIDLSPYANNDTNEIQTVASADGSVDVVRTGDDFDLSITIPANNDNDATNEIQTVASADGSVDVVRTGDDFDLSITIPANNDNDATNEIQDLGIVGDQLSITGGNTVTIPTADGSETIVNGAGINAVTGSGTTASPYVVTGTEVDGDITNEIQTLTSTDGSVTLTETNDDYNLSVNFPASSDNQNIESLAVNTTSNVLTVGIEDGTSQTVDLSHLDNTGTDNQNIESLAINTSSNVLTVGIEDGSSQTVNLSHL